MTNLLLRIFVRNHTEKEDPAVRTAIGSLSGFVGIGCNLLLFAFKLLAGTLSGSVSITADAMNNLSDASGSIVTLIGFKMAGKPADEHHPYGHARAEYLSGLAVAAMILFIGFELVKSSFQKILSPTPVAFTALTTVILVSSIAVKLWLCLFNRKLGRYIGSTTLLATAADSRNDCIATAAVLLSGILGQFLHLPIDGFMGLAVAAFILFSGWNLAKETISPLLGESADPELRQQIVDHIAAQPQVVLQGNHTGVGNAGHGGADGTPHIALILGQSCAVYPSSPAIWPMGFWPNWCLPRPGPARQHSGFPLPSGYLPAGYRLLLPVLLQ